MVHSPLATGDVEEVPLVQGVEDCGSSPFGGWYFDDTSAAFDDDPSTTPSKLLVCPCTCALPSASHPVVRLGCAPRPVIP